MLPLAGPQHFVTSKLPNPRMNARNHRPPPQQCQQGYYFAHHDGIITCKRKWAIQWGSLRDSHVHINGQTIRKENRLVLWCKLRSRHWIFNSEWYYTNYTVGGLPFVPIEEIIKSFSSGSIPNIINGITQITGIDPIQKAKSLAKKIQQKRSQPSETDKINT